MKCLHCDGKKKLPLTLFGIKNIDALTGECLFCCGTGIQPPELGYDKVILTSKPCETIKLPHPETCLQETEIEGIKYKMVVMPKGNKNSTVLIGSIDNEVRECLSYIEELEKDKARLDFLEKVNADYCLPISIRERIDLLIKSINK